MNLKVIVGILTVLAGLGAGVIEWVRGGFTGNYPLLGLALIVIGAYLIIDGIRRKPKPKITVSKEVLGIAGLLAAVIAGTMAIEQFKSKQKSLSNEEILSLERQLEDLRAQGKVPPDKYAELKIAIEDLKRQRKLQ